MNRRNLRWVTALERAPRVGAIVAGASAAAMALLIVVDVLSRKLLNQPLPGAAEIASSWLMPSVALLALGWAEARNEQIRVNLLTERVSAQTERVLDLLAEAAAVLVGVVALIICLGATVKSYNLQETATGLRWFLIWPGRAVVVVALLLLLIGAVVRICGYIVTTAGEPKCSKGVSTID